MVNVDMREAFLAAVAAVEREDNAPAAVKGKRVRHMLRWLAE